MKSLNITHFNISFTFKIIVIFIFQLKLIYSCIYYSCFSCIMCSDAELEDGYGCYCTWDSNSHSCEYLYVENPHLDEWYKELKKCENEKKSIYCPNKTIYTVDDFEDNKIIIKLKSDKDDAYGNYFSHCQFEFNDEKGESYDVEIYYPSNLKSLLPPEVALYSSYKEEDVIKENIEEISENYTKHFGNLYKLKYMILLKDQYKVMPTYLTITKLSRKANTLMVIIFFLLFGMILISLIYFNIKRISRRRKMREHLILLRAQRDLQYIQPYQINVGIDQEVLKRNNTIKANRLFDTILVEHLYKEEYNQYGGGCSICLENFNKKSKVAITPCKHVFHYKCIREWAFKNILCPKCPNCNHEILKEKEDNNNMNENNNNDSVNKNDNYTNNNNIPQNIQIAKNNRNENQDATSQIEVLVYDNALNINQRNDNKDQNSRRKMVKGKKKSKNK